ncbi:MAG: hypothetical protein N3B18_09155 [Desulfobacterota bacterium]|nr:hypothetical protein [Thermodesulfobacteriota bacterium]
MACRPDFIMPSNVAVITQRSLNTYCNKAKLAIIPFETDTHHPDLGIKIGKLFEEEIIKRRCFTDVIMIEETPWDKQLTLQGQKLQAGIAEARRHNADVLLWGIIEHILYTTLSHTRFTIQAIFIDAHTSEVLWRGRAEAEGIPGDTYLFWGQYVPDEAPPVMNLIHQITKDMTDAIFSDQFINISQFYKSEKIESVRGEEMEDHSLKTGSGSEKFDIEYEKDILDGALEELNTIIEQ